MPVEMGVIAGIVVFVLIITILIGGRITRLDKVEYNNPYRFR